MLRVEFFQLAFNKFKHLSSVSKFLAILIQTECSASIKCTYKGHLLMLEPIHASDV